MKKICTLLFTVLITLTGFSQIRISQVYGAGGNSGATYNQDFVEIYNANAGSVTLDGWSIQYAAATSTANWVVDSIPDGTTIGAGKYLLIGLATGATGSALPTPDVNNSNINLSGTAGKVALVSSGTPLNGTAGCSDGTVVDIIGYGSTANCAEGSPFSTTGSMSTQSIARKANGCVDAGNNSSDLELINVNPRNSGAVQYDCTNSPVISLSGIINMLSLSGTASAPVAFSVYGVGLPGAPGTIVLTSSSNNFEISLSSGSGFGASVNIPYTSSSLPSTPVYLRIAATAPLGAVSTDIIASGANTSDTVTMTGNVLVAEPTIQASNIVTSNITDTSMTINWTNGNGGNRIVVIHPASAATIAPTDSRSYNAALDVRTAQTTGSGNYVVFNGTGGGPINILGLLAGITYTISVYEYDSSGTGTHNYLTSTATNNPVTATTTGLSTNLTQINFTALLAPQYTGSGTATRTPTLYYARLNNLAPNTTYRYYTQAAISTDLGAAASGAGNPILFDYTVSPVTYTYTSSASVATAGGYGKFTTDASGTFQGTFGFVNTGNARFTAGNTIYPSIVLAADPATTAQFRFALNQTMTVLTFAASAGANNGTFLQGASLATAGNLVAMWDNVTATGRPLSMTLAENPTFTGSTAWATSFVPGYSTTTGSWNTIIPNTNANGVRLIQQFDLVTGDVTGCDTDADGTWPTGAVVTANPAGGVTPLAISAADAPLNGGSCFNVVPVKLEYLTGYKAGNSNALTWKLTCLSSSINMEIERSADTRNFSAIGTVTATQARCAEPFNYIDNAPLKGRNFYRLKITDVDGRVSYSPVVLISSGSGGFEFIGLYPSVVHNETVLSVSFEKATTVELNITDMHGKIMTKKKQIVPAGSSLINIDCSRLAAGVYNLVGITGDGIGTTIRFVKL